MFALLGVLLFLVIGFMVYAAYIYNFDHKKRAFSTGDACSDFSLKIAPRTGQTDSWPKILTDDGQEVTYYGAIYDVTIDNIGECNISGWTLRVNIREDCYINNAWCGTFEIHQNDNGKENVQTLDLRNYSIDELTLNYRIADPDLMIPLRQGDYIIYYPDFETNEYPISAGNTEKLTQVVFGMIFYNIENQPVDFSDYDMEYYLQKNYKQSAVFQILILLTILWFICFIIFTTIEINMKKAHLRFEQDEKIIRQSIGVFTQFFEAKDIYTNGHSQRVARYSKLIAQKIGYTEEECRQIYYIGLMHDCGKCYIPDAILKKPGKLTDEEFEIIKEHTVKGAQMLKEFTAVEHMREGVLYHHERYDGRGYPTGIAGEDIPLVSRIICVADSFDAMNSRRCYRDMLTKEYILSEFENNSGRQFDPKLVKIFMELIKEGKIEFIKEIEEKQNTLQ